METITKFNAPDFILKEKTTIEMPRHAEVLSIHVQNNELFMFAKVNTERQTEKRCFAWISSDQEIPIPLLAVRLLSGNRGGHTE